MSKIEWTLVPSFYDYPYIKSGKEWEKTMFVLVDHEGNIKGRFDHLMQGEALANSIENSRGHGKLEWAGMRNYNEGYGTNGVNFYRMLEDQTKYAIYDRYSGKARIKFDTFEKALGWCNGIGKGAGNKPLEFVESKPGLWWGHNAPSTPDIIKDSAQGQAGIARPMYDYYEIRRERKYDGLTKV